LCESHSWLEWSGFLSANTYELHHLREYYAIRTAAALIDISPLYKYQVHGRDALKLINRLVTRDVSRCAVGQVMYSPWCDEAGKVIDDGTIARLDENLYRITAADPSLRWFQDNASGLDVKIEDVSEAIAAVALQGPLSRSILQSIANVDLGSLKYYRLTTGHSAGIPATISRTGYTGDLGYEIWVAPQDAERLWDALFDAGRPHHIRAAGNLALDMARIEAGLLLVAVDFVSARKTLFEVQKSTPFELGLGWTVRLEKGNFVGREALIAEKRRGPAWATVGLEVHWDSLEAIYREFGMPIHLPEHAWSAATPVYADGRQIGKATSGTWSPILKKYVVIARLRPGFARPGTPVEMEVTVEATHRRAAATVVEMPFFSPERKRL
jgi:aminomethyltransferase